ncbi:MAG: endonuclease/exonuclease/phosphatase family protein [Phycisphaeraceae bacterium]|nr:endonuclease/exonuclease/phosphatase family protein [Phycisphaerales bacterium]MCB9860935.1 endonuclease/exonuclease/phosphatase family protein [Phycisphaeraceae bacterium]
MLLVTGLATDSAFGQVDFRMLTWNIETVGTPGSSQYNAAVAVLNRLGADVVAINEVANNDDANSLQALASATGYQYVLVPSSNPFGATRNAIISKWPFTQTTFHTSPALSGSSSANDITRWIVEAVIEPGNAGTPVHILSEHWKASTANEDEFRRAVESIRISQAIAGLDTASDYFIVCGDVNDEIDTQPNSPAIFTSVPSGVPGSFVLGPDIQAMLSSGGIPNNPFAALGVNVTLSAIPARQKDNSDVTRPSSGRRLDYVFVSGALLFQGYQAEVYDSLDEALPGGLMKFGSPLAGNTCALAADHLPVIVDLQIESSICYPDCDENNTLNVFDYICFGNAYASQQIYADCDGSGSFNVFDYICFGNAYATGCP